MMSENVYRAHQEAVSRAEAAEAEFAKVRAERDRLLAVESDNAAMRMELSVLMDTVSDLPESAFDGIPTAKMLRAMQAMDEAGKRKLAESKMDSIQRENAKLRADLAAAQDKIAELQGQRSGFDCAYAGDNCEFGNHLSRAGERHVVGGKDAERLLRALPDEGMSETEVDAIVRGVVAGRRRALGRGLRGWNAEAGEAEVTTHTLKTMRSYWRALNDGTKTFEVRRNDRDFAVGDVLVLECWAPDPKSEGSLRPCCSANTDLFTSDLEEFAIVQFRVTYVMHGGRFGIDPDYVVLGLGPVTP